MTMQPTGPFTMRILEQSEADLAGVERVIAALDDRTYGRCGVCGGQIDDDRLATDPLTQRCTDHDQ